MYRSKLNEKLQESLAAVLPILAIVLILSFTIAPLPTSVLMAFLFGAVLLVVGIFVVWILLDGLRYRRYRRRPVVVGGPVYYPVFWGRHPRPPRRPAPPRGPRPPMGGGPRPPMGGGPRPPMGGGPRPGGSRPSTPRPSRPSGSRPSRSFGGGSRSGGFSGKGFGGSSRSGGGSRGGGFSGKGFGGGKR